MVSDKRWLIHLDDRTRSIVHSALDHFCGALASRGEADELEPAGGLGGVILP